MSNWREMLKEAKELFDDGLLDEAEYKAEKARIMAMRAQSTNRSITGAGLEQERAKQAERERLAELKRQEESRKRKEQERVEAEKRRKREEKERKEREAREKAKREKEEREPQAREEAERQRKAEEERLAREQQERLEAAKAFAKEYQSSMAEIESKRKSLKSKLEADIESARKPLSKAEGELTSAQESLHERRTITASITEMESTLADLESGFWSFMKGSQITTLKDSLVNKKEQLSRQPSETDLTSSIQSAKETVESSMVTFNTKRSSLEKAHQTSLNALSEQESRLNAERVSYRKEFPVVYAEPLDIVLFGSRNRRHEMVLIPKGDFMMGALEDDGDASSDEKPRDKVTLTRDFLMGKYPMTQVLWESVMGANPSRFKGANRPVENVSWFDVVEFCNKLSEMEGLEPVYTINGENVTCNWTAKGYRLPTEAEWEYAARANQGFKYAGSDDVDEVAWYSSNSGRETHPVGQKKPNGFGLYDMSGNVDEWVWDFGIDRLLLAAVYVRMGRVRRGGSWGDYARCTRLSNRSIDDPTYRLSSLGFRLSRSVQ